MASVNLDYEELKQEFLAQLEQSRRDRLSQLDTRQVAWLAVAPVWTDVLARSCQFPEGSNGLDDFLEKAKAAGLCESRVSLVPPQPASFRARVLVDLARYLPETRRLEALDNLASIGSETVRAEALAKLSESLSGDRIEEALAVARRLRSADARVRALAALAPKLPEPGRSDAFAAAFEAAASTADPERRFEGLLRLVGSLQSAKALGERLLATLQEIDDERVRAELLNRLVPLLPDDLLPGAMRVVQTMTGNGPLASALVHLVPRLPEQAREIALGQALALADGIDDVGERRFVYRDLATAQALAGQFEGAVTTAEAIDDDQLRVRALGAVALALGRAGEAKKATTVKNRAVEELLAGSGPVETVRTISDLVREFTASGDWALALQSANTAALLAQQLPLNAQAVPALRSVAGALSMIGNRQAANQLALRAVRAAEQIDDPRERSQALVSMAPLLQEVQQRAELPLLVSSVEAISDVQARVRELVRLVPLLSPEEQDTAIERALGLSTPRGEESIITFWMPERSRRKVLEDLRDERDDQFLRETVAQIAPRIQQMGESWQGPALPRVLWRWAEVAGHTVGEGPEDGPQWLDTKVGTLVESGQIAQALDWLDAAASASTVLPAELDAVVALGYRRVELVRRQEQDRQYLTRFLERREQTAAFEKLLTDQDMWALHFIGWGGVGKTMLIRNITSELAVRRGFPTARLDFDYITPDFPVRRPGQLLLQLGNELAAHVRDEQQVSLFRAVRERLFELHQKLSQQAAPEDFLANIDSRPFNRMLTAFCGFLERLPAPVVLILDTCEELTKEHAKGASLPQLEATFKVLERIHAKVPTIRLVLAGRRPLARSGAGWEIPAAHLHGIKALLPAHKPYLGLHEIRGFTEEEAREYLLRFEGLRLSGDELDSVLRHSPEAGRAVQVAWSPPRDQQERPRYNPFDVGLYADWIHEDREQALRAVSSGESTPYIQVRIVDRLRRVDVERLLPALALLGRFDRALLRLAFDGSDEELTEIYRELSGLEWIDYQYDEALDTDFLSVNRELRPRLLEYYRDPHDPERNQQLEDSEASLRSGVEQLVADPSLRSLGVDHVAAALRFLPDSQAADFWNRVVTLVIEDGDWGWARAVTDRLLSEEEALTDRDSPLHAVIRAVHLVALNHTESEPLKLVDDWLKVAQAAPLHPDPMVRRWLMDASLLGRITACRLTRRRPPVELLRRFGKLLVGFQRRVGTGPDRAARARAAQLIGATCSALEALLDLAEQDFDPKLLPAATDIEVWLSVVGWLDLPDELTAYAQMLGGRTLFLQGRRALAVSLLRQALDLAPREAGTTEPRYRPDRYAPKAPATRTRMEALRLLSAAGEATAVQAALERDEPATEFETIDAERLASTVLDIRLRFDVVPAEELESIERADEYDAERQPLCHGHHAIPPIFVSIATAWLALGAAGRAMEVLDARLERALEKHDAATARAAERAKLEVIRRMRISGRESALIERYARSTATEELASSWTVQTLAAAPLQVDEALLHTSRRPSPQLVHAWWRTRCLLQPREGDETGVQIAPVPRLAATATSELLTSDRAVAREVERGASSADPRLDFAQVSLLMDWAEAMAADSGRARPALDAEAWWDEHPVQADAAARLWLRDLALSGGEQRRTAGGHLDRWAERIGTRRLALLALDEGELLALRQPQRAVVLLDVAHSLFEEASDAVGGFIAAICAETVRRNMEPESVPVGVPEPVVAAYDALLAAAFLPDLPPWPQVAYRPGELTESVRTVVLDHPDWGGWLHRLVHCLAMRTAQREAVQRVRALLRRYYRALPLELWSGALPISRLVAPPQDSVEVSVRPSPPSPEAPLPARVPDVKAMPPPPSGPSQPSKPMTPRRTRPTEARRRSPAPVTVPGFTPPPPNLTMLNWSRRIAWILLAVLAVVVAPALFGVSQAGLRWLVDRILPRQLADGFPGSGVELAANAAVLVLLASPWLVPRTLARIRTALTRPRLSIRIEAHTRPAGQSWEPLAPEVTVRFLERRARLFAGKRPTSRYRRPDVREGIADVSFPQPYAHLAAAIPPELGGHLASLEHQLGRRRVRVPLTVDAGLDGLPWEAILTLAGRERVRVGRESRLVFSREDTPPPNMAGTGTRRADRHGVDVLANPRVRSVVEAGWGSLVGPVSFHRELRDLEESTGAILHLVGTAVETPSGLLMNVGADFTSDELRLDVSTRESSQLVLPDRLPLTQLDLVVVQAQPVSSVVRVMAEREQIADLRACAADILRSGARAVLLLPALPSDLAQAVIREIAQQEWSLLQDERATCELVPTVQQIIIDASWRAPKAYLEPALDITLFVVEPTLEEDQEPGSTAS